jgi:glycine dehydrogenase subunit 1
MTVHKFLPNSSREITSLMLDRLGLQSIDELYADVPNYLTLKRKLDLPAGKSEIELEKLVSGKLSKNMSYPTFPNFIGGGCWVHHVPSVVDEILSRGEFYSSYTPYQPEISQGMLQAMFEYQSQICELTGMEVANSSMYDWASALGEAGRMAMRVTRRKKILVAGSASPERVAVLRTYCVPAGAAVEVIDFDRDSGRIPADAFRSRLDDQTAAIYFENPNFLGIIEESLQEISEQAREKGALSIIGSNPATLGVLKPPGELGADIVVGDGQPLGVYSNFGGPIIGIFATRRQPELLRQMPGRLIGMARSKEDPKRFGFAMILQTREQHIRRELATSNICTNEALFALAVSVFLALLGPSGMKELGQNMIAKSHYAQKRLMEEGVTCPSFSGPFFGELTLETSISGLALSKRLVENGVIGGLPLGRFYEDLQNVSLFSFNETHSLEDIEKLVSCVSSSNV